MAMDQSEGVAEFVNDLFGRSFGQQGAVGRQAVPFIVETENRSDTRAATQKGLAENIGEDGNEEVDAEQPECFDRVPGEFCVNLFKQLISIVLTTCWIEEFDQVQMAFPDHYIHHVLLSHSFGDAVNEISLKRAEGDQVDMLHRVRVSGRISGSCYTE